MSTSDKFSFGTRVQIITVAGGTVLDRGTVLGTTSDGMVAVCWDEGSGHPAVSSVPERILAAVRDE